MMPMRAWRLWTCAVVVVHVVGSQPCAGQTSSATHAPALLTFPADYPEADQRIWELQQKGRTATLAREALAVAPDAIETVDLLVRAQRVDDAIEGIRRVIDRHPADVERALRAA